MQFDPLRRRDFITLLGAAAAWPLAAYAQQTKRIFKVGHLESGLPSSSPYLLAAFQQGLRKLGYIEGENLFIERRYAEGLEERLPQLAAELVRFGVDVIFAIGPPQALAAAKATSTIPIVFVGGGDPVAIGLVKSLAHPGGNVTGLTLVTVELAAKRIQLLKEVVPAASRVAILWNPNNSINKLELNEARAAGNTLGLSLVPIEIRTPKISKAHSAR
jgi:putative tryptophan/tyrosine transport system substrate-binding protein